MVALGEKPFRATQMFQWIQEKSVDKIEDMRTLPKALMEKLQEVAYIKPLVVLEEQSSKDGTKKYLLELEDGSAVEAVFMKYKYGNSICISSQVGCRMGCKFCASTMNGLARNLRAGEMIGEIIAVEKAAGEKINHIVIMGTGEPMDNYENVSHFLRLVTDSEGRNLSSRNITVSTCGVVPSIVSFADDFKQVNLAISLHATTDEVRSKMMPVNKKYNISQLLEACKYYVETTGRRITFEYTMVSGVNDGDDDAKRLISLLAGLNCHVNLIPLNKVEGTGFDTVSRKRAYEFMSLLENAGVQATVRRELGSDIDGACGQLRMKRNID